MILVWGGGDCGKLRGSGIGYIYRCGLNWMGKNKGDLWFFLLIIDIFLDRGYFKIF